MRKFAKIATIALVVALAGCNGAKDGETVKGDAIAAVPAPAGKSWTSVASKTELGGIRMGNPDAKLKLVEYGAITCPGCAKFSVDSTEDLAKIVETGTTSMEFRPYLVHGVQDIPGFLLAQCNGPESFFALTDQLYAKQPEWLGKMQTITPAEEQSVAGMTPVQTVNFLATKMDLVNFVKERGVPEEKAKACLNDQKAIDALIKLTEYGQKEDGVSGTPTLILNGTKLSGGSWNSTKTKLREAGAR